MNFNFVVLGVLAVLAIIEIHNGFVMMRFNQNIRTQKRAADAKHMEMSRKRNAMFDLENHTKLQTVKREKRK